MIKLDGSHGEGGGQIIRNAAVYAAILGNDLSISKIRAGRSNPGLRRQHVTSLNLLAQCCGGEIRGAKVGSQEILFRSTSSSRQISSKNVVPIKFAGDTKTAGSICLLLQAALPAALLHQNRTEWVLKGGTTASNAPQFDYWQLVFLPTLQREHNLAAEIVQAKVLCRGFFPKGGGEVHITVDPLKNCFPAINLIDRGDVTDIVIRSIYSGKCPRKVAESMTAAAKNHLEQQNIGVCNIRTEIRYENPAVGSGSAILVIAHTSTGCRLAGSALGSTKQSPQNTGIHAAAELCAALNEGGCVDEYLQDQLILYMALAEGSSQMITGSLTLHTETAIWTAEQCSSAKFEVVQLYDAAESKAEREIFSSTIARNLVTSYGVAGRIAGRHLIRCQGIGFVPPNK